MNFIYRVSFIGRLNKSQGHTTELQKTFTFDRPATKEEISLKLYDTHEHIRIIRITDLSKAAAFNEVI